MRVVCWDKDLYIIAHTHETLDANYSFSLAAEFCEGNIKIMIHEKGIISDMDLELFYIKSGTFWTPVMCNGRLL